eukprot:400080-Rhodomonas_salina.2
MSDQRPRARRPAPPKVNSNEVQRGRGDRQGAWRRPASADPQSATERWARLSAYTTASRCPFLTEPRLAVNRPVEDVEKQCLVVSPGIRYTMAGTDKG